MQTAGKWCLGHAVIGQAESLRTGHYVEAHLVPDVFSTSNGAARVGKGLAPTLMARCAICRSIQRHHAHHANAVRRASKFRSQHARRWVKAGRHPSEAEALLEMEVGGVTDEAIAALIVEAIDAPCPGLCAYEHDGDLAIHDIKSVAGLAVDVRDPAEPFSMENLGILCNSCNSAKGDTPWARFIYRRRAALRAWRDAIRLPKYRRGEQLGFQF